MDIKPEFNKKSIRSFVVRAGRMTEGQRAAFDSHWPTYGLRLADGALDTAAVFGRPAPTVVEIGFGMGDSLLEMAQHDPETDFIGIEVHPPGVGRLINSAALAGVTNLRVYMADATDVLQECIADRSLARIQLYFPDPWHKKKHNKRRIVQPNFVALLARKLAPGGVLHMATDWQPYAEHMLEVLGAEPLLVNCSQTTDGFSPRPDFRPVTKFERRGERLGHGVWDLLFETICGPQT